MSAWFRRTILSACSALLIGAGALPAQHEALVDPLAGVLAATDARQFDRSLFRAAARHPSPIVRRHAALGMGRIGNPSALSILLELSLDPDSIVQMDALFALGLIADSAALDRLRQFALTGAAGQISGAHAEAVTAIARIGGRTGGELLRDLLNRWLGAATRVEVPDHVIRALAEAWRLGPHAPIDQIVPFVESRNREARWRAVYSLARLRETDAASALLRATEDADGLVRSLAIQVLDATFADSAHIDRRALARRVQLLVNDPDPRVRVNALRALGTYGTPPYLSTVADRAADGDPNVRVQALSALGEFTGSQAADALLPHLAGGIHATRREALLSLARVGGAGALEAIEQWTQSGRWRERAVAAQALRLLGDAGCPLLYFLLLDDDARVTGPALSGLLALDTARADSLAVAYHDHEDPAVRAVAIGYMGRHPRAQHREELLAAFTRAEREKSVRLLQAVIAAVGALVDTVPSARGPMVQEFLARFPGTNHYLVRRAAAEHLPEVAAVWGPATPLEPDRGIEDYRGVARDLVLTAEVNGRRPTVVIETDRGDIVVELLPEIAPLTITAFLELIDRRYFDGSEWHRVVPNFVIQDGDPRGDGRGSAGFALRDEVSRAPYLEGTMGLARAGPDTGSSQFFITHSPQPHLEGAYTVFGRVTGGRDVVDRISLGDRIRRVRRQRR